MSYEKISRKEERDILEAVQPQFLERENQIKENLLSEQKIIIEKINTINAKLGNKQIPLSPEESKLWENNKLQLGNELEKIEKILNGEMDKVDDHYIPFSQN